MLRRPCSALAGGGKVFASLRGRDAMAEAAFVGILAVNRSPLLASTSSSSAVPDS